MPLARVLFVLTRPSSRRGFDIVWSRFGRFYSLAIPLLAAVTPQGFEVEIREQDDPAILHSRADLVAFSLMTSHAPAAYSLCDVLRRQGKTVVVGGVHPSALPEEAKEHADVVAVGEGERIWRRILCDFVDGRLQPIYRETDPSSLRSMPYPRHDLMPHARNGCLAAPVQATRGCPFDCEFCSITNVFGRRYRMRPVSETVAEIRETDSDYIAFVDDNIASSKRHAAELFRALAPLKKRWVSQCDISIASDTELLSLAAKSGCIALLFGLESVTQSELDSVGKHISPSAEYEHLLANVHSHGIMTFASFIVGLDGQSPAVFESTLQFARKTGLGYVYMPILTPFPGTRVRARLQKEERILHSDWSKYDAANVVFKPRGMTEEELRAGWEWAITEIASFSSVFHRLKIAPVQLRINVPFNVAHYFITRVRKYHGIT